MKFFPESKYILFDADDKNIEYLEKIKSNNKNIDYKKNRKFRSSKHRYIFFIGSKKQKKQWLNNYLEATKKKDVDLIIELIGGSEGPAKKLVFNALKNKKHVVTANKALIAKHGDYLSKLAEKHKVNLEFEASVAGGIPILRTIKEGLGMASKAAGTSTAPKKEVISESTDMVARFKKLANIKINE